MKVLIAEDDFTSRTMLKALLSKWGYEVVATADGEAALTAMEEDEDPPRLALLDWMMPAMDGPTLCRELRRRKDRDFLYLVLLTSKDEEGDMARGLEAGADDYLFKPYETEDLRVRVRLGERTLAWRDERREKEKLRDALRTTRSVCHRLAQPLQIVSGYSQLLLMNLNESDSMYRSLMDIRCGVEQMGELTREIVEVARSGTETSSV